MIKYLLLILLACLGVHCTIQFQHDTEQCLDQLVEYQCTVTGTGFLSLTWRISEDNGTLFGNAVNYASNADGASNIIGGVFTVEQLQPASPVVSNISFTVQSSINGYTIVCEDSTNTTNSVNLMITILDPPSPPNDIIIVSCTSEMINFAWTQPTYPSVCYNITGYTVNNNITDNTANTTDTSISITLPNSGLSAGMYCISIASIDTANRIGTHSEQECFNFIEPSEPFIDDIEAFNGSTVNNTIIRLNWIFDSTIKPPLTAVYLNISTESSYNVKQLSADTTQYEDTIMRGVNYTISVFGENIIGNGTINSTMIFVEFNETLPLPPTDPPTTSTSATSSTTASPTTLPNKDDFPIVAVVVPIVIIAIIILAIVVITVLVFVIYKMKSKKHSEVEPHPASNKNNNSIPLKETGNHYQQQKSSEQTLYADLEVATSKPSSSSKKTPQPSAVEYSSVKHEVEYTALSHSQPAARGKRPDPTPTVNYSAVSHH